MTRTARKIFCSSLSCLLLCAQLPVSALETDADQEITWSADGGSKMTLLDGMRIWELADNVIVRQGTLEIIGDQAVIEINGESNELQRVTVHGNPVRYQQQLDDSGALVIGSSLTIEFYEDNAGDGMVIDLVGDANIASPDTTMHCATITYLADTDLIRDAQGPCQGSLSANND